MHSVFDEPVDEEFIALAKKNHALYCPTLFVMESYELALSNQWRATPEELKRADPEILAAMDDLNEIPADKRPPYVAKLMADPKPPEPPTIGMQNLERCQDAGVTIVMGTDAGNIGTLHGPSISSRDEDDGGVGPDAAPGAAKRDFRMARRPWGSRARPAKSRPGCSRIS